MPNASVVHRFSGTMAHPPTSENAVPRCFARAISDSTAALRVNPHCSQRASQDSRTPRSSKTHFAGEMAIARTSLHFSVTIHRQQVPTVIIRALHVLAVRAKL